MKIAIVGNSGGTNIGASLERAARALGHEVEFFDAAQASAGPRLLRALAWRFGRPPLRLQTFSRHVIAACASPTAPHVLVATGIAPLTAAALATLRQNGVACINYSTDDPWSHAHRAPWQLRALPQYDVICTPRKANMEDFRRLGCRRVEFVAFGYDDATFKPPSALGDMESCDILFVGGADLERVDFIERFVRTGLPITLVGDYWDQYPATAPLTLGHRAPEFVQQLTAAARINLCLVRRSNRDGHVMRSLEAAATGACMLVEDTTEHRNLFGADDEAVCYFQTPDDASQHARELLADEPRRRRLTHAALARITNGHHTYRDRMATFIELARTATRTRNR